MAYNPQANRLSGCDRISELPDSLLTHILSYLPTNHYVKTSALSTRWKNVWLNVPVLDLDCYDFPDREDEVVLRFIDRLLEYDTASRLLKVKVQCRDLRIDGLKERISTVIHRGLQHLDVMSCYHSIDPESEIYPYVEFMPLNLYTSRTLVSLKLRYSGVEDPGFVCMPCLKSMTLLQVHFRDDVNLEKLVSGCPVLEELILMRDISSSFEGEVDRFMRVRSGSLKRFRVPTWHGNWWNTRVKCTLEIDAPGLEHLTLRGDQFDSIVVEKGTSLFMVYLNIDFVVNLHHIFVPEANSKRKIFGDFFLSGISNVRHMIISEKTVKAFGLYSRVGMIPKFNNLSRLEAVFPKSFYSFLPTFLECCPNLKHLILKVGNAWEMEDVGVVELTNVSGSFLSTLECVELKRINAWEEPEMKVVTYSEFHQLSSTCPR